MRAAAPGAFPDKDLLSYLLFDAAYTQRLVDLGRTDVARRAAQRREILERRFRSAAIDHLPVSTAVPYERDLLRFFKDRAARARRPQ
jgi:hypothetical protein